MTHQLATLFAQYNRTMNERVFVAAGQLGHAELSADRGAFFGSVLGTLNHIAVADTLWLHRFAGHAVGFPALAEMAAIPRPTSLRQTLGADLASLRVLRQQLDGVIERWAPELTAEQLDSTLSYSNMAGVRSTKPFGAVLQHVFNHQTHHRGQVSTLLFQLGVDVGVTDFITFVPDVPGVDS